MKFGAHQTFHLKDGWIYKGLNAVMANPEVFSREDAVEVLGVGKNMVESMEYWLNSLKLISKSKTGYELTKIAELMMEHDPYFELDGTAIVAHYLISTNKEQASTFYWFFNCFLVGEFDRASMNVYLESYVQNQSEKTINPNTLDKDISCLVRTYKELERDEKNNPENENPSPFSKFNLIKSNEGKLVRGRIDLDNIHPLVFVYLLFLYWSEVLNSPKSFGLDENINKEMFPSMVLGLNHEDVVGLVEKIAKDYPSEYLDYSRTGGFYIINIHEKKAKNALRDYYKEISE